MQSWPFLTFISAQNPFGLLDLFYLQVMSKESSECLVNLEKQKSCLKLAIISNRKTIEIRGFIVWGQEFLFYVFNFVLSKSWRTKEIDLGVAKKTDNEVIGDA